MKTQNQQNYTMNTTIFFNQTNNNKNFRNSKHENQKSFKRLISKNFDFEKKDIVTIVKFYYLTKINE